VGVFVDIYYDMRVYVRWCTDTMLEYPIVASAASAQTTYLRTLTMFDAYAFYAYPSRTALHILIHS